MDGSYRGLVRKIEHADAFPLIALQAIRDLRAELDSIEAGAILRARELGASLSEIADEMNISRQGVAYKLKTIEAKKEKVVDVPELEAFSPHDA